MALYLHKSLCDLKKAGQLPGSAGKDSTGEQRGGDYYHRIQTGYSKQSNSPTYRYFKTKDEFDAYSDAQGSKGKQESKKTGEGGAKRLKEKTESEQAKTKQTSDKKQKESLFLKDPQKKVKKALYITMKAS